MKKAKEVGKKIAKILEKEGCVIVVNLSPKNLFTKIFRRFIEIDYQIIIKEQNAIS
jgi:ABC-type phosphate/phosphonate transport system ATPase subunit